MTLNASITFPAFFGENQVGHGGTFRIAPNGGDYAQFATAWMSWQLRGNHQTTMFLGEDCDLCSRPNWKVQKNNNRLTSEHLLSNQNGHKELPHNVIRVRLLIQLSHYVMNKNYLNVRFWPKSDICSVRPLFLAGFCNFSKRACWIRAEFYIHKKACDSRLFYVLCFPLYRKSFYLPVNSGQSDLVSSP